MVPLIQKSESFGAFPYFGPALGSLGDLKQINIIRIAGVTTLAFKSDGHLLVPA